jgi:hypothetical protein
MFQSALTSKIAGFLNGIGIAVVPRRLDGDSFLPGIEVENGKLFVDEMKLVYPGDLLHEAGHLAVAPSGVRHTLSGDIEIPGADMDEVEVMATAWAYAALVHLDLEPQVLFHAGGYGGHSDGLIRTFAMGVYPGAHKLQEFGMAATREAASQSNGAPFPRMVKWVRD